ncbi:hypothetical protein HQ393_14155 [Chitinibacter bivalviorum]|uniref:Uncharacterized protein n=1 Tax=Chitinibacter bivalviorum TaxID=2739434 RepID=A0A7H9BKT9_9NEIS|nr:hypothetical protein [Chitinibacter bivalviorum]QLG89295.1 hypothetical protein HQ393_14155 [Chitinibacter bivalviorum]
MELLPTTSETSLERGSWFVFQIRNNTIRAWCSHKSGLERIYLNEKIISERRGLKRISEHIFNLEDHEINVTFKVISIFQGTLECTLYEDGRLIKSYLVRCVGAKPFSWKNLLLGLLGGVAIGSVCSYLILPPWLFLILIGLIVACLSVVFVNKSKANTSRMVVEEKIIN